MAMRDSFLPEFEHEMETTRKTLERVPEDKTTWKPHDTSMAMGRLAGHIAEMAGFAAATIFRAILRFRAAGWDAYAADRHDFAQAVARNLRQERRFSPRRDLKGK